MPGITGWPLRVATAVFFGLVSCLANAQDVPDFSGTWSDPPPRAEDAFCHVGCTVEARDRLTELLEDPANLDRTYGEIRRDVQRFQAVICCGHFVPTVTKRPAYEFADGGVVFCD